MRENVILSYETSLSCIIGLMQRLCLFGSKFCFAFVHKLRNFLSSYYRNYAFGIFKHSGQFLLGSQHVKKDFVKMHFYLFWYYVL